MIDSKNGSQVSQKFNNEIYISNKMFINTNVLNFCNSKGKLFVKFKIFKLSSLIDIEKLYPPKFNSRNIKYNLF